MTDKMMTKFHKMKLNPCPICGRLPKIHYFTLNYARAHCRRWNGDGWETHFKVYAECRAPERVQTEIVKAWNAVTAAKQPA